MKRTLKWVKPSQVKPYMNNPRRNDDAVEKVAESIAAFGFNSPIVVDENLEILAGHTRWKAALKLELDKIPVFVVEGLSEEEKRAYRIADNRMAEYSSWDWEKLQAEIEKISSEEMLNLLDFNFSDSLPSGGADDSGLESVYEVVVECESEEEQQEVFEKLTEMGLKCRLLTL